MTKFKPFSALNETLNTIREIGVLTPDDLDDARFYAMKHILDLDHENGALSAELADEMLEIIVKKAIRKKREALDRWNCHTAERFAFRSQTRESSFQGAGDGRRST